MNNEVIWTREPDDPDDEYIGFEPWDMSAVGGGGPKVGTWPGPLGGGGYPLPDTQLGEEYDMSQNLLPTAKPFKVIATSQHNSNDLAGDRIDYSYRDNPSSAQVYPLIFPATINSGGAGDNLLAVTRQAVPGTTLPAGTKLQWEAAIVAPLRHHAGYSDGDSVMVMALSDDAAYVLPGREWFLGAITASDYTDNRYLVTEQDVSASWTASNCDVTVTDRPTGGLVVVAYNAAEAPDSHQLTVGQLVLVMAQADPEDGEPSYWFSHPVLNPDELDLTHDLLSATHTDTTPDAVVAGDLIRGQGEETASWARLPVGNEDDLLQVKGGLPTWVPPDETGMPAWAAPATSGDATAEVSLALWVRIAGNTAKTYLDSHDWRGRGITLTARLYIGTTADAKTHEWQIASTATAMIGLDYATDFVLMSFLTVGSWPPPFIEVQIDGANGRPFLIVADWEAEGQDIHLLIEMTGTRRPANPDLTIS